MGERNIIALAGRKECGKSTVAKFLEDNKFIRVSFATPLKQLIADIINCSVEDINKFKKSGINHLINDSDIQLIHNRTKVDIPFIEKCIGGKAFTNTRDMMQVIGTDIIREFNKDWHVNETLKHIKSLSKDTNIVVDDVRFDNEKKLMDNLGAYCWYIVRNKYDNISNHISETALSWHDFYPNVIINDSTEIDLIRPFEYMLDIGIENYKKRRTGLFLRGWHFLLENYFLGNKKYALYNDFASYLFKYHEDNPIEKGNKIIIGKYNLIIINGELEIDVENKLEAEDLKKYLT